MRRVLVVYKKDAYRQFIQERRDAHLLRLLRRRHPDVLEMRRAHDVHQAAMAAVTRALRRLQIPFDLAFRATLKVTRPYDLIVSVGGDGTFLQAARSACLAATDGGPLRCTPLLGVNADPQRSEAVFCAATPRTFARLCPAALDGRLPALRLYRLRLRLNGERLAVRALNDVLMAHENPATMSRYRLAVGGRAELQKSSGLWVATAAGSSSAALAAGGVPLPWSARRFQYRPRELYRGRLSRCRLRGGVLSADRPVRVTWLMRRGAAFIDGPHVTIPLRLADELEIRLSLDDPLTVLGCPRAAG
jgi:NAD+ kinase